ncbi:MAG: glycosyltransferase [Candidatus Falkowbacteria bacterium]
MDKEKDGNEIKIAHLYFYGDQHHKDNEAARCKKRVISDGGSNIHTNFLLRIKERVEIIIHTYQDNYQVKNFFGDSPSIKIKEYATLSGLFKKYLLRIETVTRCFYPGLIFLFKKLKEDFLVTQTDFLPDTFAAFCAKIRNPKIIWIASFFLAAPAPWDRQSPYRGKRWIIGLFYWLLQIPSIWFIKLKADKIIVTSEPDVVQFVSEKRDKSKIIVVQGGVDITDSEKYLGAGIVVPVEQRKYDACFVGRFHCQKGVLELVDIWKKVCAQKPTAKLAMIGIGQLESDVEKRIKEHSLADNIDLLGFKDGGEKYEIFKQSKIMVHPATYDSGGMAAAGGMAWGLPAVSFDLEALQTYYPKGMIKSVIGDDQGFADNLIKLLDDKDLYARTTTDALSLIRDVWNWDKRADEMYKKMFL